MSTVEKLFRDAPHADRFARAYLEYVGQVLRRIDAQEVARFIQILLDARARGSRISFIGNGGSAATASHFANDLAIGSRAWSKPFKAVSLCDNQSVLTAIANDYGYEQVFLRQLQVHLAPDDVVVAISASGNSPNLLHAIEYANALGSYSVGLTGFDGGRLRTLARASVHVPTNVGDYGPAEDAHMVLDHLVGAFVMHLCREDGRSEAVS